MDGAAPAPPPRRRLPTKTSSGRISITPLAAASTTTTFSGSAELAHVKTLTDEDAGADEQKQDAAKQQTPSSPTTTTHPAPGASGSLQDEQEIGSNSSTPSSTSTAATAEPTAGDAATPSEAAARSSMIATTSNPAALPRPAAAAAAAAAARAAATAFRPAKAPPSALATGPLNSSSAPHVVALPVKRRGSYQSLKRNTGLPSTPSLHSDNESQPNIVSLVKKTTHWERFGTILVLGCLYGDSETTVMQMLHAEGYDTSVAADQAKAMEQFNEMEVFPDIVLVDCDLPAFSTLQLITQFQALNPTVAVICLGSRGSTDAVSALQAGAADYMYRPVDLSELVARIERHVQRQHCVKLQLESVLEDTRSMMAQLSSAMALGNMVMSRGSSSALLGSGPGRLIAVAETDFEQQITELSEENQRLGSKLCELEERLERKVHENGEMAEKLTALEVHVHTSSSGMQGQLCMVAQQNSALIDKVDALERIVRRSQECVRTDDE